MVLESNPTAPPLALPAIVHLARLKRGSTEKEWPGPLRLVMTVQSRFWEKVDKDGPNGCWVWTGTIMVNGYGRMGHSSLAHRLAYEFANGPIPERMDIDHICHNRICVNPNHLRVATRSQNLQNSMLRSDNTCGFKGAYFDKRRGNYYTLVPVNGSRKYYGPFPTPELAHAAYCEAASKYHGEFANFGEAR